MENDRVSFLKKNGWKNNTNGSWADPERRAPPLTIEDALTVAISRILKVTPTDKDPVAVKRLRAYIEERA